MGRPLSDEDHTAEEVWESTEVNENVQCCATCCLPLDTMADDEYVAVVNEDETIDFFHLSHAPRVVQIAHEEGKKREASQWN